MTFLLTLLFGWLGYYRFHKKQYGLGVLYLFTGGVFGIGWLIDICMSLTENQGGNNNSSESEPVKTSSQNASTQAINNGNGGEEVKQKSVSERTIFDTFYTKDSSFTISNDSICVKGESINFKDCDKIHIISGALAVVGKGGDAKFTANGTSYKIKFAFEDNVRFCRAIEFANKKIFEAKNQTVPLYSFISYTGSELLVYENHISITHVRTSSGIVDYAFKRLEGGGNGAKDIEIEDISAIQNKEPTKSIVGFVQFSYSGIVERRGSAGQAINDENSIPYYFERISEMKEIVDYLLNRRRELKNAKSSGTVIVNQSANSQADELKKYKDLLDSGVLTQEEFDRKKKELLGL